MVLDVTFIIGKVVISTNNRRQKIPEILQSHSSEIPLRNGASAPLHTMGFLPKISFTPLLLRPWGILGVKRSGKVQGTRICWFGALLFSQN
jgi:hypothetical protein